MIAATLATKPKLLLLDEPIAGLSPDETRQSIDLFKNINKELGITIIIIEHFMKNTNGTVKPINDFAEWRRDLR